jgi:hypothetical protein
VNPEPLQNAKEEAALEPLIHMLAHHIVRTNIAYPSLS